MQKEKMVILRRTLDPVLFNPVVKSSFDFFR